MLCLQQHPGSHGTSIKRGIRHLGKLSRFNFSSGASFYDHYYVSQVIMNHGGKYWPKYNKMFRNQLLKKQTPAGAWHSPPGNRWTGGTINNVCFAVLMLEVYYRYLPSADGAGID